MRTSPALQQEHEYGMMTDGKTGMDIGAARQYSIERGQQCGYATVGE